MQHLTFTDQPMAGYPVCFLVPKIQRDEILRHYIQPIDLDPESVLVLSLHQSKQSKKTPAKEIQEYITSELIPVLQDMQVEYLLCTDGEYFKALTKSQKVDAALGYVLPCVFGPWKVVYVPNHRLIFYDPPKVKEKIKQALTAFKNHVSGTYADPGTDLLLIEEYPETYREIQAALEYLLTLEDDLACDIEGFGLKHYEAGIGSISFAWNQREGLAFLVDYKPVEGEPVDGIYGTRVKNEPVRALLLDFFLRFAKTGRKLVCHNIAYDVYVLIYQLFMEHLCDTKGLLRGMDVLLKNWDCTKLITYLATNSCAGNKLGLKDQSQEFAGNYSLGDEIADIRKIPADKLLRYNLIDAVASLYVRKKHWGTLIADQQEEIYEGLFKSATRDIIQMQLTGLPVNMKRVLEVEKILNKTQEDALAKIQASPVIKEYLYTLKEQWVAKKNATLKVKRVTLADAEGKVEFNPGSSVQLQDLLYERLNLPVINVTDTKLPCTKKGTIIDLKNHTDNPVVLEFLDALIEFKDVNIIITTFIPALKNAQPHDGWHYLFGNFNLGGTLSGRLSSSDPNLQNLPATSKYAKLIKSCIEAPPGWIFIGLDFASLEDRISALTTKDPNKLKVYTDGYDGHSLRAYAYYTEQMPDIDPTSVESINSIQKKYKPLRDKSKNPTFTLTYQGTWNTLVTKYKFTPELAKVVEERYHALYEVSDKWVADRLTQAGKDGYVSVAFGLRVRTPVLAQVIRGTSKTPYEGEAEGRSAGNALGQSWCLLNSRAAAAFMDIVRSDKYALDIRPCAQIHDAQYYLIREDPEILAYCNEHLVREVKWQDHPEIWHDEVKLGGEIDVFYPTWANGITIPNGADAAKILEVIDEHMNQAKG